jgi:hypothetical protein
MVSSHVVDLKIGEGWELSLHLVFEERRVSRTDIDDLSNQEEPQFPPANRQGEGFII